MNATQKDPRVLIANERAHIDCLDCQIARLLCTRHIHVMAVGKIKAEHHICVHDPLRESRQLEALRAISKEHNVPESTVIFPFRAIINLSRARQGERDGGPIVPKTCMIHHWRTAGIESPDGSGVRVCPACLMPLV